MTVTILVESKGTGARYTAVALHADPEAKKKHEDMGFLDGWGRALEQLVKLVKAWK